MSSFNSFLLLQSSDESGVRVIVLGEHHCGAFCDLVLVTVKWSMRPQENRATWGTLRTKVPFASDFAKFGHMFAAPL